MQGEWRILQNVAQRQDVLFAGSLAGDRAIDFVTN